jgi:preprotein translocase subunit Sss1
MIWFGFATNIFILLTGIFLYITWCKSTNQSLYNQFIILTAVSAGIAAFGHLDIIPIVWQKGLLVLSRIVNILAIYSFAAHSIRHFGYDKYSWVKKANVLLFLASLSWLLVLNYANPGSKPTFLPVIVYGAVGMVCIGMLSYIIHLKEDFKNYLNVVLGVLLIISSAVIFKLIHEVEGIKPSDISHILIAFALILMTYGVKKNERNESKK